MVPAPKLPVTAAVLHQVGAADLNARSSANTEPDVQVTVAVEDVIGAAALELITAFSAEEDIALTPDEISSQQAKVGLRHWQRPRQLA